MSIWVLSGGATKYPSKSHFEIACNKNLQILILLDEEPLVKGSFCISL